MKLFVLLLAIFTITTFYCRTIENEGYNIPLCYYTHSFEIYTLLYIFTLLTIIKILNIPWKTLPD